MSSYISYLSPGNESALALREADDSSDPIRVVLFGSFYGGLTVLKELIQLGPQVVVTGLATDDPRQSYTHPGVRLWRYPHDPAEERMVQKLGEAHGLEAYTGRINTLAFRSLFFEDWNPDLCLMATFGQRIPTPIFRHPPLGFSLPSRRCALAFLSGTRSCGADDPRPEAADLSEPPPGYGYHRRRGKDR